MSTCQHKHTKYQPTDEEWRCPKCGASYDDGEEFVIWDAVGEDCSLLHDEDYLKCQKCGYETTGKRFAAYVVKKNSLIPCPTCKGKGVVKKNSDHLDSLAQVTRERDELAGICAAVIKNLGIENDDDPKHLPNHAADISADRVAAWNAWREEASERDEIVNKLYAAERERDEAVEALRRISKAIALNPYLNQAHAEAVLQAIKDSADIALAKMGERNA